MASTISSAYPDAPAHWSEDVAREMALQEGLELTQDHLDELRALSKNANAFLEQLGLEPPAGAIDLGFGSVV